MDNTFTILDSDVRRDLDFMATEEAIVNGKYDEENFPGSLNSAEYHSLVADKILEEDPF